MKTRKLYLILARTPGAVLSRTAGKGKFRTRARALRLCKWLKQRGHDVYSSAQLVNMAPGERALGD